MRAGAGVFYDTKLLKDIIWGRQPFLPAGITFVSIDPANRPLIDPNTGCTIFDMRGRPPTNPPASCPTALITPGVNWVGRPLGTPGLIDAVLAATALFQQAYLLASTNPIPGTSTCELVRSCTVLDPNYKTPYTLQFNVGIQRELRPGLVLSVDYVRHRGLHYMVRQNINRLGAADTLDVAKAQAAIAATNNAFGCGLSFDPAAINCAIANGATIQAYANRNLGRAARASATSENPSAFAGLNPNFNGVNIHGMQGRSTYNALQVQVRGSLPNVAEVVKDWNIVASYTLSRLEGAVEDYGFLNFADAVNNDNPLAFSGPTTLDRTHIFSLASLFTIPGGFRLNSIWRAHSALPQSLFVPQVAGGAAEIFFTDLNGDGVSGDPLPGTNRGSYGRDIGCGAAALNHVIDAYNSTQAGQLTPAGQALVNAGLFTTAQLKDLGAVSPAVPRAPAGQVCLDSFVTTDIRVSRPFKLWGERMTVEPAWEWFNLFNVANYDLPGNKLSGVLTGTEGSVNGTTPANRPNRAGFGAGSFALGTPRSWQFALRVSF